MVYDGHLLLMLVPILFMFYASVEIYRRNPAGLENRVACIVMLLLLLLFILDFAQLIVPHEHIRVLTAVLKYPLTLLSGAASVLLHLVFTRKYHRLSLLAGGIASLVPLAVYMLQLAMFGPAFFIDRVETNGFWSWEQPTAVLNAYLLIVGVFALLNTALSIRAWRRADARFDKHRFLILIRTDIIFLAAYVIFTIIGRMIQQFTMLPSTYTLLPGLAWGVAISLMMNKTDFLPRLARRYEMLFRMSPVPIVILDKEARIRDASPKAKDLLGISQDGRQEYNFESYFIPEDRRLFRDMYGPEFPNISWQGKEMAMRGADGHLISVLLDMEMMAENGEPYGLAIIRDITQRKNIERFTDFLAHHDLLTELPNRSAFKKALDEALAAKNDAKTFDAVLLVDLDRFKLINDTLGHQCGDDVLKIISARFRECLDEGTVLARAGGDEFMILVRGAEEYDEIIRIAEKLQNVLESPVLLLGSEYYITASIGISLFPGDGITADAIIKNADIAMYHAKSNGGNHYRFFSKELNASIKRMVDMEKSLRRRWIRTNFSSSISRRPISRAGRRSVRRLWFAGTRRNTGSYPRRILFRLRSRRGSF